MKIEMIELNIWHNTKTPYGVAQYHTGRKHVFGTIKGIKEQLRKIADNVDKIKFDKSVTCLAINTDERFIFQVSGYSNQRGAYCDII